MTSYGSKENQCRNFAPNIFNKNKCQNCFKPRETHLLSDKDLNKATPIFCGWLLLAPIGTDFDNPTHRARKWQRRYFVLFEHGALRYALDDNANTLPQGTINMNQCSDVIQAEVMTGQKHSLCIFHPEMKYFIRSESKDDATAWCEQLIVFPQTVKQDALNKKRFAKKYGSAKAAHSPTPVDDTSNKVTAVTYDELRSPKAENPREKPYSPELIEKRSASEIKRGRSISRKATDIKQGTQTSDMPWRRAKSLDRGDSRELSNDITSESLNHRKGWLLKKESTAKETWTKHWFVLAGSLLKYYQDPAAEEYSNLEGEVNLDDAVKVTEVDMSRNYGFTVHTADERDITLAAVTSGIRKHWMNSLEKASSKTLIQPTEKTDAEKAPVDFDEKMVETTMLRRTRMRARRKAGRARTYDFAELRSAVPATVDVPVEGELKSAELEFRSPSPQRELILPAKTDADNDAKVEVNGFTLPEIQTKETVLSPKTSKPFQMPIDDGRWEKIEMSDVFSRCLLSNGSKSEKSSKIIQDSFAFKACNDLKSEVDMMERQIEKSQQEFDDFLEEQCQKLETNEQDALKGMGNSSQKSFALEDGNVDRIRALEMSYKCAIEENKRLRDEMNLGRLSREQESSRMQAKIRDLKYELSLVSKRSGTKSSLKSETNDRSLKDKVTELEAEMEDTGQMLARRLSALENPRRKETDDSDEAGSSSSCSSINLLTRMGKSEEEKSETKQKQAGLESTHQKLSETIKSLQEARNSTEFGATAVQEAFNVNKATVLSLQKKLLEYQKNWASVKKCLQELKEKVAEVQGGTHETESKHVLPFLESVLNDTLQMMGKGSNEEISQTVAESSKKLRVLDAREIEKDTLDRLKYLSEQLKANTHKEALLNTSSSSLTSVPSSLEFQNLSFDQKDRMFAEQLSHEAMVIAEMAGTLERYAEGKSDVGVQSSLLHSDSQDIFPQNSAPQNESGLLQQAGILAEKLLLESRLVSELSKLRVTSNLQSVRHEYKSSSLPLSGPHGKQNQGNLSERQGMTEETASLSLVQAQINYVLHIYNDRIARLSQDVKEAQHRADVFQQKLHELVNACKTKDIELVSQLAVEVDTKASLALTVEDLPEWRQQVDYGMLHGAQACISNIDLQIEASFFAKLSQDISAMSSDASSLFGIGTRLLELDVSLFKALKPSVIGDRASIIAYEAVSQAQLLFLCRRITKDYEEEVSHMKSSVRKQSAHCEALQQKLKEMENSDDAKMQELKKEHKQKVERLVQQLALVEQASQEMSADMDQKLNKITQKQHREMEKSEARHRKENEELEEELSKAKTRLQESTQGYSNEVGRLEKALKDTAKNNEHLISAMKIKHEKELDKQKNEYERKIKSVSSCEAEKVEKMKAEFRGELDSFLTAHEREITKLEEQRKVELKQLKEKRNKERENESDEKEKALRDADKMWAAKLKEKQDLVDSLQQEKSKELKHDAQIDELQNFFERKFSDFKQMHKKELEEIEKQYQLDVRRLEKEKAREMDEDVTSTKMAIMSMKKHYQEQLVKTKVLQEEATGRDPELQNKVEELKRELEVLSELYSNKCVEISKKEDDIKYLEERLLAEEENNLVLKEQNDKLSTQLEEELGDMRASSLMRSQSNENEDVHHLRIELGTKKLQVTILQQQMESLKQQVATTLQGRGFLRRGEHFTIKSKGYDIMKSKSHPDFMIHDEMKVKGVKRRSSERSASKVKSYEED